MSTAKEDPTCVDCAPSNTTHPTATLDERPPPKPKITITYCTQCRWLLRAAYYAQELLTTFPQDLAEVALRPATGGAFTVALSSPAASGPGSDPGAAGDIEHAHIAKTPSPNDAKATRAAESDGGIMPSRSPPSAVAGSTAERRDEVVLWERKTDGGFPETKELKRRVRDWVDPGRGLGHVDRG